MTLLRVLLAAVAATATVGRAADAPAEPPSSSPGLSARANAQWLGAAGLLRPAGSGLPGGNRLLRVPGTTWQAELRLDARVEAGSRAQAVARPRLFGSIETIRTGPGPVERSRESRLELTEAFLSWRPTDALSVTWGLQNFQWGPAELIAPSNRLFHETGTFRGPVTVVRGRHLARVNVSAGRQWSFVALAEVGATDEAPFRSGAPFRRAAQGKLEVASSSGASWAGLTAGARAGEPPWFGGYGAASLTEGLSAYVDASLQRGSQAWYPVPTGSGSFAFEQSERSGGLRLFAVAGLRYSISASLDARLEYVRHDAGYNRAQAAAGAIAVAAAPTAETLSRWLRPGLELLGRDLLFVSFLATGLPPGDRVTVQGRYVRSLTDGSGAGLVTASLNAADALVVFSSLALTHGPELAEFTRLARAAGSAGFIWSF